MVSMTFLAICAYVFLTFCFLRTCLLHLFICAARSLLHFLSSVEGTYVGSVISTVINEAHLVSGSSIAFAKMLSFPGYMLGPANLFFMRWSKSAEGTVPCSLVMR